MYQGQLPSVWDLVNVFGAERVNATTHTGSANVTLERFRYPKFLSGSVSTRKLAHPEINRDLVTG